VETGGYLMQNVRGRFAEWGLGIGWQMSETLI